MDEFNRKLGKWGEIWLIGRFIRLNYLEWNIENINDIKYRKYRCLRFLRRYGENV